MPSSWSDLPLELLISIRNVLYHGDLFSFRLVCSEWHSASPITDPGHAYITGISNERNIPLFNFWIYDGFNREHFISSPHSIDSISSYFHYSNGWLVYITYNDYTLYLFDVVSNRKFTSPPLKRMILRYHKKVKSIVDDANQLRFQKIVVSSSFDAGITVAGIVEISNRANPTNVDHIFIFCRHAYGDCQKWSVLKEGNKGIRYIALAGDKRFYALSNDCKLYMLDERPPLVKLKKIKLWLPKHILENSLPFNYLPIQSYGMKKSGETDLKIYGYFKILSYTSEKRYISLKINVAQLHGYSNNIEVACDAKWRHGPKRFSDYKYHDLDQCLID